VGSHSGGVAAKKKEEETMTVPVTRQTTTARGSHAARHALYEELCHALREAIWTVDTYALEGFLEGDILRRIAPADIPLLWQGCWQAWPHSSPGARRVLGMFLALMHAWYPGLRLPAWATAADPEAH
jgi:hypothetical protein